MSPPVAQTKTRRALVYFLFVWQSETKATNRVFFLHLYILKIENQDFGHILLMRLLPPPQQAHPGPMSGQASALPHKSIKTVRLQTNASNSLLVLCLALGSGRCLGRLNLGGGKGNSRSRKMLGNSAMKLSHTNHPLGLVYLPTLA